MTTPKTCVRCRILYPDAATEFSRDVRYSDGFKSFCRACSRAISQDWKRRNVDKVRQYTKSRKEHMALWEKNNPEKVRANRKRFKTKHREKILAAMRANRAEESARHRRWREKNRDRVRKNVRASRLKDPERAKRWEKAWRDRNPLKAAEIGRRYRARKKGWTEHFKTRDVQRLMVLQSGECFWCSCDIKPRFHVDHLIPLARGGDDSAANIVLACPRCNQSKNALLPLEWMERKRMQSAVA